MEKKTALLKSLIGHEVLYHERAATVVDVIEHPPELVLQIDQEEIQEDSYGTAYRESPRTVTVPIVCQETQDIQGCLHELLGPQNLEALIAEFTPEGGEPAP